MPTGRVHNGAAQMVRARWRLSFATMFPAHPQRADHSRVRLLRRTRRSTVAQRLRRVGVAAVVPLVGALILASCGGGEASMSCATFTGLAADAQADAIASVSADLDFIGTDDDVERMRSGAERACAANADQQIGGVVGGFVTALAD